MIVQVQAKQRYTLEEYLEQEVSSQERNEYIDGEIIQMTGGTPNHNKIALNLSGSLNFVLRRHPYQVFMTDQRLWIPEKRIYTYPDIMVVHGELQFQAGRKDTITNPIVIIEVLFEFTQAYDRNEKFKAYRTIPTFQEYVLIDQYKIHVEKYCKTEPQKWISVEYDGAEATVSLDSVDFEISLIDLYNKVDFELES